MKKAFLISLFFIFAGFSAQAQLNLGINPGFTMNGFYIGYQVDDFVPYVGVQFLGASLDVEQTDYYYNEFNELVKEVDKVETSASVLMPYIGAKYFAYQEKDLKLFINLCLYKPLVSATAKVNGEEEEEVKTAVDNLSLFGAELGIGAEYYFSKQFSLGGEFGFRMLFADSEITSQDEIWNPNINDYEVMDITQSGTLNLSMTYVKVSLNYYFGE